jgi:hypothetical protein
MVERVSQEAANTQQPQSVETQDFGLLTFGAVEPGVAEAIAVFEAAESMYVAAASATPFSTPTTGYASTTLPR